MSFRELCLMYLTTIGVIVLIGQFFVTTRYDLMKTRWWRQNSSTWIQTCHEHGIISADGILKSFANKTINMRIPSKKKSKDSRVETIINTSLGTNWTLLHKSEQDGFQVAASVYNACISQQLQSHGTTNKVRLAISKKVTYCPMEKIGTTFWRRVFYMIVHRKERSKYATPYDVPIQTALVNTKRYTKWIQTAEFNNNSFSFLFVRDPFSRLLSAYIDKLVAPNPFFWKTFGGKVVSMFRLNKHSNHGSRLNQHPNHGPRNNSKNVPIASDVTFPEFVKLATYLEKSNTDVDPHIMSINRGCKPCTYPYTFIGRMESFHNDALLILKQIGFNSSVLELKKQFKRLHVMDSIKDSKESPFSWKREILKTITWDKALERIWLKLQMRGIISTEKKFDLTSQMTDTITCKEFIDMAIKAHDDSDPDQLKTQKDLVKKNAFASVPIKDIIDFRNAFKDDFVMFGYNLSPSYIFDQSQDM